jgi:hypothetical protein
MASPGSQRNTSPLSTKSMGAITSTKSPPAMAPNRINRASAPMTTTALIWLTGWGQLLLRLANNTPRPNPATANSQA